MVVFFDIDGTLVDDKTQIIPDSAVQAVDQLVKNGHLAVINTGRPYGHIDPRIRAMAFQGWICGCGMEIYLSGQWLRQCRPDPALCQYTVESLRECGMWVLYEDRDVMYRDGSFSDGPGEKLEADRVARRGLPVLELSQLPEPTFQKFVTHDAPGCRREEFLRRMEPYYTCIDRGNTMVEYVLKGSSKARGMELLLDHLNIPREDTLAIGDSTNDLPMFSVASHTVCMGGGMDALKQQAEYVTSSVLDGGIRQALVHFDLI